MALSSHNLRKNVQILGFEHVLFSVALTFMSRHACFFNFMFLSKLKNRTLCLYQAISYQPHNINYTILLDNILIFWQL